MLETPRAWYRKPYQGLHHGQVYLRRGLLQIHPYEAWKPCNCWYQYDLQYFSIKVVTLNLEEAPGRLETL